MCNEFTSICIETVCIETTLYRNDREPALLFRDSINVCKLESGSRNYFEFSEYPVCTGSLRIRLVVIYRPPYSINHPVTVNSFIDEFSEYLESVILSNDLLCLTGDFNPC